MKFQRKAKTLWGYLYNIWGHQSVAAGQLELKGQLR